MGRIGEPKREIYIPVTPPAVPVEEPTPVAPPIPTEEPAPVSG
jgi:hypothetical protein